jgi:Ca-activated chloride channel family protein
MKNIRFLPMAALMFGPLLMLGQQLKVGDQADSSDAVFSTETRLVPLNVTVTDKSGRLVTNLPESAFQVFENGVQQTIRLFKREDIPVSMGLIIDNSGSMREKRRRVETAALAMVRDSNPQDEVFIVNFNDEAFLDAHFTNDAKVLEQGLTRIDSRGGTAMRDAIRMSIDHLKEKAKRDKKVILVVTDGNDQRQHGTARLPVVKLAQQDDVLFMRSAC